MYDFKFHSAFSVDDAAAKLAAAEDGTVMAGGQTLIPVLKQRLANPSDVVDLSGAGLSGITNNGDSVTIGAMTTHAEVAGSSDVSAALRSVAEGIGDAQVRNRGTLGGSVANNDPAADYPAALLGLGATITTNQRDIAADDFFTGLFETALNDGEIIKSVTFPNATKAAYAKFPNPASRYAMVGVFAAQAADGVRVAVTGATDCAHRGPKLEAALSANWSPDALDGVTIPADHINGDIHGSPEYRAHLVVVMAKRAVAAAG
ncbi:MAG: xanthine dehydrogenase family protein subunit M [Rhodospirillaceae bacterium]|jgi:aerobic carbon-monoxide dehydrogenase medium subunit|nr:xanthine dehydrogenase family protein subunit M [Rhodospirillaceae bacterium]MBT4490163.1 xanthine dehydrogenase family protein subunit M [Rhodospirillaceae bacterium]MBT5191047.1 xanthine dehydrogenase family protein subunit M [Rhodospirillaceae bacterium]MBT5895571.1 xanthine dehydrogenase family protein subunit M [Rhodospirillaceae bacterium]MBT6428133.1 xanthine dehydrogenase family protein subunit M [Rhodospirillaceae bacterium]